ncbi:MAG: tetratricopeptide repeat protein [Planctomycetes bacterium]|nr:tetratricopeptide repeat protein [Planctomycetota bacterium]
MNTRFTGALLTLSALAGCLAAAAARQDDPRAAAETALKDRDWAKAEKLLKNAIPSAKQDQDELLFLLATAQQHAGRYDDALATLDRLLNDHPASPLCMKALFRKGDALASKKDFASAARITDNQVAALTAPPRRKKLAMVYVDAAREFLTPQEPHDPTFAPNYPAAQKLLAQSLELEALGTDEEAVRLDIITCEHKGNLPRPQLLQSCRTFLERFPTSTRLDEALFAQAAALRDLGRVWEAEKTWLRLATDHPTSKLAPEALFSVALLHLNETAPAADVEKIRRALPNLRRVARDYTATEFGPRAAVLAALTLSTLEELRDDARRELTAFADAHPKHERAPDAMLRVAQLWLDDQDDAKAIAAYEDCLKRFPDSPRWPEIRQSIANARFNGAERAFARKDWPAARAASEEFVALHAADPRAPAMAIRAGECLKEEKKSREAVDAWMKAATRFASDHARLKAAELLATELDEFELAMKELAKVGGSHAGAAQELLRKLQAPSLAIESERVFRSDETPKVKLTLRNLEKVKLRLWTLDLNDYFEKKASMSGLQSLEVSVIAPDREWEHAVENFKRFKETKLDVELPMKAPGAYVVTAGAGEQEATTVVLVSDLAMIARAGRKAATVLVQNLRTGLAVEKPTLRTAADGKHLKTWTQETTASRLSLMAESDGHLAFRDIDVSALPAPADRAARALVLTDRRTVAPEDEVRVRLIVRGGDKNVRVAAVSAQGVVFFEKTLALSKVGAAATAFRVLPGLSDYVRVDVFDAAKPQEKLIGQASIEIGTRAEPAVAFDFLWEDKPYFAGDDIDVTVVLRDPWGRPMPNRKVRIHTSADAEPTDAVTGDDGTVAVPLRDTASGLASVTAEFEGIADTQTIPLLPRGVLLSLDGRVMEPVLSGEKKTLTLIAKRADDTPVSRAFRTAVTREGLPVASGEVTTDKDGKAPVTFVAKEGGLYRVRVFALDADGLPMRAETVVQVFDDQDEQKLRLRSATDEFEPGRPMEFTVFSRLENGLAFVTVEGEHVEQVVPVTLRKGVNAIKLGPPPSSTRDFAVAIMMMQANAFHADARDFGVKTPEVRIEPEKKEIRPGEEATVRVKARPGSEVILIAAEHVVVKLDPNAFHPIRPGPYFIGDSSAATSFAWATRRLDPQILDAIARLRDLEENRATRVMLEKDLKEFEKAKGDELGFQTDKPSTKKRMVARGGGGGHYAGKRGLVENRSEPAPLVFASEEADASGIATFRFRIPQGWGQYTLKAWAVDSGYAIGTATTELKARAPVTVVFRVPESAVEGEKTSAVALLTNHTSREQEATLALDGVEVKVKLPARSTREHAFEWTAAESAEFALDGVRQVHAVALRPNGPIDYLEAGGAFTGKTEIPIPGDGRLFVRVAAGPEALLESLAEGPDAAARLIALIARHRRSKTEATKLAVMEFAARRAAGLADPARDDAAWPVLLYLAAAEAKAEEFDIAPDASMLKARFAQATHDDIKALILFALARGGEAQFGYIHRLWRAADTLSPRALACVALALKAAGKPDEAKAALNRLAKTDHWEAIEVPVPDASNTTYATTALVAFAMAEVDPTSALLPKARAWLLARSPATPFERAVLALAMQSAPDQSGVTELKVDGQAVKGFGEVAVSKAVIEPAGAGTYYALARRETPKAPEAGIKRTVEWPALVVEGITVPREAVAVKEPIENPSMGKVAAGQSFVITHELTVRGPRTQYRVVEFPPVTGLRIPAAARRVLIRPQTEAERTITVSMPAYADAPGAYDEIEVLPAGRDFLAGRQMTHGERLGAGRVRFEKKQWKEARATLAPLFEKGTLLDGAMIEAARMLAYAAVELADHETAVRAFEVLKEKSPGEVVPFDKIRGIGRAYAAAGEHERAMQVHSGTCDAYFLQEANVVGALEELGRTRQAVDQMKQLLAEHPDSALNKEMLFGLGQRLYSRSKAHRDPAEKDPKQLTREELLAESAAALERYLAWFPAEKDGENVSLTLGSAYLEAGKHGLAERTGRAAAARYPKSRFLDSYDYVHAFGLFAQRKFAEALILCDRLETFDYGKHANPGPGVMRDMAVLMKAQIFHAKGELDKAIENYKKVRATSADAARSVAFLEREAIAIPDLTVAPMSKPAELELEYAGVAEAHVRAYKVDLTMLALRRKGLADAASIEVAGFKPVFERRVALDHPDAKRRERQRLALELKSPGAYLIGVKAGDFFAGGLVLRSDLAMTVQEERGGTVRVNIADAATGAFAEGVKVTIFGTQDQRIASDKTDLRGVWETEGVTGLAVVVAEKDGHVAMYRGQAMLGMMEEQKQQWGQGQRLAPQQEALDEEIFRSNDRFEQNFGGNVNRKQQGVEVERTKK